MHLERLILFRGILSDPLLTQFLHVYQLSRQPAAAFAELADAYCQLTSKILQELSGLRHRWPGDGWTCLLLERILSDENLFSSKAEKTGLEAMDKDLMELAAQDLRLLEPLGKLTWVEMIRQIAVKNPGEATALPSWNLDSLRTGKKEPEGIKAEVCGYFLSGEAWGDGAGLLARYYQQQGVGLHGRYYAFQWDTQGPEGGSFRPVQNRDPITFDAMFGYETEQAQVIRNTRQFLAGLPANNVLLYGDRGTGKSSTVKALVNCFGPQGLRLIEIGKNQLQDLQKIMTMLKDRGMKYIIYIDDLSFSEQDSQYAALKAVLEGGLSAAPSNVLIYATSNRRHLLPEKFSDRDITGMNYDDVRFMDTMQEKLSLADRFGMTVTFTSPNQKAYLAIVDQMAGQRGLPVSQEELHKRALLWELQQNSRSPRTARQFLDALQGEIGLQKIEKDQRF